MADAPTSNELSVERPTNDCSELSPEQRAMVSLSLANGIGPRLMTELLEFFGDASSVLKASRTDLMNVPRIGAKIADQVLSASNPQQVDELLELCRASDIDIVDCTSSNYPGALKQIPDPPNLLFVQGSLRPVDSMSIAIVGSRHATTYGKKVANQLGRGLAMAGFTVVSGLARGIDAAAHKGALEAGGRTLAVLGSGILNLYPPEHGELAREVFGQGAVISEFHPLQAPKSGSFPQRNRIVTGLSLGVIVVEAADRSGALISARLASEQNREVFAVPGRIDSRMSRGCHGLLRDGATLVQSVDDVLEQLGPLAEPAQLTAEKTVRHPAELKLTEQETKVLQLIDVEPTDVDTLIHQSGLPVARVLSTISVLEIRRLVRRLQGNRVMRV